MKNKYWIQKVKTKKGALHRQLSIPENEKIPFTLLDKIIAAKPGETIKNPTKTGKKTYKVTKLIEKRANYARNLKNISKKK
jgi:hypothetical protein